MSTPQDRLVDRRSFVARMGALTALAATGGCAVGRGGPTPVAAAHLPDGGRSFYRGLPRPDLSAPGTPNPGEMAGWEAGALLRDGAFSAEELVQEQVARIRRWDGVYRAWNTVLERPALDGARALDNGGARGLLSGVTLAVKDNYYTEGVLTTGNSHIFATFVPGYDATVVARIRAAGGLVLGKTQMGPLATTRALTPDGEVTTVNAWTPGDPRVNPGGSSTGSATAVAARMAGSSIGTQTGGSITAPALAQGLTGLKPTMGRVSLYGVIPLTYTRDHPGPLARDARDAALLLQVMAGEDPQDPRTHGLPPVPDYLTAATPVERRGEPVLRWPTRIGVLPGWADGEGEQAVERRAFLREMEAAGAVLVEVSPSERWRELTGGIFNAVRLPERSEPFLEYLRRDVRLFGVSLSSWMQGLFLSGDEYLKGQRAKLALLQHTMDELLADCDVVVQSGHVPFDMIGLPLITFPTGMQGAEGAERPRGILLGAGPFGEERLLSVAAAWQARTDFHLRRPPEPTAEEEARLTGPGAASRGRMDVEEVAALSE